MEKTYRNSGALFRHLKKTAEKQPDFRGDIDVNGIRYQLSGWKKLTKNGDAFLSLSIQPKDADAARSKSSANHLDDPLGF